MKYIKEYKIYEGEFVGKKSTIVMMCIDSYSVEVINNEFELELDEPIYISQYYSYDSKITKLIKTVDGNDVEYWVEVIGEIDNKMQFVGLRSVSMNTIKLIYEYLIKKYPEIREADSMGFFDLKKV